MNWWWFLAIWIVVVLPLSIWLVVRRARFDPSAPPVDGDPGWVQARLTANVDPATALNAAVSAVRVGGFTHVGQRGHLVYARRGNAVMHIARIASYWLAVETTPTPQGVVMLISIRARSTTVDDWERRARTLLGAVRTSIAETVHVTDSSI